MSYLHLPPRKRYPNVTLLRPLARPTSTPSARVKAKEEEAVVHMAQQWERGSDKVPLMPWAEQTGSDCWVFGLLDASFNAAILYFLPHEDYNAKPTYQSLIWFQCVDAIDDKLRVWNRS